MWWQPPRPRQPARNRWFRLRLTSPEELTPVKDACQGEVLQWVWGRGRETPGSPHTFPESLLS